jgi:hypothetical protein
MPRQNLAATLYGTVLVSSVIVGLDEAEYSAGGMMAAVTVTAVVFASAHGWSRAVGRSADLQRRMGFEALRDGIRQEWPMVEAVGPTLVALALAAAGVYSANTGLWVAIVVNVILLFAWGAGLRQRADGTPVQVVVAGLQTSMLGLVLVALKALVH